MDFSVIRPYGSLGNDEDLLVRAYSLGRFWILRKRFLDEIVMLAFGQAWGSKASTQFPKDC
jgi:hypothetical protein